MHKIVVVTPAGRERYLELLKAYLLDDPFVAEWHLWDNCRKKSDRTYIDNLAIHHEKIRVVRLTGVDGTNQSVNRFYKHAADEDTFYFKLDDDIVFIQPGTFQRIYDFAVLTKDKYIWWSPLVINNAICSWILKYQSKLKILPNLSAQASDTIGWRSPFFAYELHRIFLDVLRSGDINELEVGISEISASRFSINFIGFFGSDVKTDVSLFCPQGVDDEEWISAVLPLKSERRGVVLGDKVVSHFSFYPQERYLLKTSILEEYYKFSSGADSFKSQYSDNEKIRKWWPYLRSLLVQHLLVGRKPSAAMIKLDRVTLNAQ